MQTGPRNGNPAHTIDVSPRSMASPARAGNAVLGSLTDEAFALLQPVLREERFGKGALLWDTEHSHRVYFPLSGLVVLLSGTHENGIQVGCVGRESAVGFGAESDRFNTAVVQVDGLFLCAPTRRFQELAADHPELRDMAQFCADWLLIQAQRNAACNAVHDAEKRLCRWLLQVGDRGGREFSASQEEMAQLLGLRRTTLTLVAHKVQAEGIIRYRRGRLELRDRARLEALACDCYRSHPRAPQQIAAGWDRWAGAVPDQAAVVSDVSDAI